MSQFLLQMNLGALLTATAKIITIASFAISDNFLLILSTKADGDYKAARCTIDNNVSMVVRSRGGRS